MKSNTNRIVIIGAGVSGLAAAVRLAEKGVQNITIVEARRTAGGRTRSYVDPETGDVLDNGQHLLMGCYTSTLEYLQIIGTDKLLDRHPLRIPFWSSTGVRSFTIDRSLPPPMNLLSALTRTSLLTVAEKRSAAALGNALWRLKLPRDYQRMTCAALFDHFRQLPTLTEKLWEPMVLATLNATPSEASAELFVNVIREAFFRSRSGSALVIPKCGLSELLIDPALEYVSRKGVSVKRGNPVREVVVNSEGISLHDDTGKIEFDRVISTIPSLVPPDVISNHSAQSHTPFSTIVNAYFWLDRSIFNAPIHAFIGTTLQWAFPRPSQFAAERLALTVSAANGLAEQSNDEIRDTLWNELQRVVPAAKDATLLKAQIIREKRATPLLTPEAQRARPKTRTNDPRIVIAGDLAQNGLPATIEGAVRNGFAAAEEVLKSISTPEAHSFESTN